MTSTTRRLLSLFGGAIGAVVIAGIAFAVWTSGGSGNAVAAAGTFGVPGTPSISVTNGTASLSWTASTAPGTGTVDYYVQRREDAGSEWSEACSTSPTVRITATNCSEVPGAGTYVWRVTAYFQSWTAESDESTATTVGTQDSTPPTVSVALASGPTGAYLNGTTLYFKANAAGNFKFLATVTDAESGPASATFPLLSATNWTTHSAQTVTTPAGGPYQSSTYSWVATASAPATHTIIGADVAGNTVNNAITFAVDSTAPTGSVTAPAASANVGGTSVAVTSSSADAASGVASAQFQSTPHGLAAWSNIGAADTTSPYATTWDTTSYTDGLYDLRVITTDNVGNTFTSATIANVKVDNTDPTGAITSPASSAAIRGTFSVTANSADGGSGVLNALFQRSPAGANTWTNIATADTTSPYAASWVTTGVTDGLYDLQVITTDKSGNTFTSAVVTNVRVDNTAPTVSLAMGSNPAGAFVSGTKIYFKANAAGSFSLIATVTDGGSGAGSAAFPLISTAGWTHPTETDTTPAGGPYQSTTISWTANPSTPGTFTVTAADAVGNTKTSALTFTVDSTSPTGAVTAPAAAANIRGSSVSVTSNSADAGSGVASAQFQTSPAGAGTWSNLGAADTVTPFAATWNTTTFTDGLYDLRVITTDNVGNTFTSATIASVRVDNTTPSGAVTAPAANAFVNGASVAVSSSSADAGSGVLNAQFQTSLHGTSTWSNLGAADTTSPYSVTWNTTTFTDGQYDLQVITTDKAGNTFTSAVVTVEVQNAAPTPTAVQLVNGGSTAGKAEQGDQIVVTYSQTLSVSTMCSTWSGNFTDQALTAVSDVTVTLTDGGAGNDTMTVTSATCTFHFGTLNLGSASYVTGGSKTFSGSTTSTRSTIAWNATSHTLTVTLGAAAGTGTVGTVASSAAVYTPDAAIKNGFGTAITGTFTTGTIALF